LDERFKWRCNSDGGEEEEEDEDDIMLILSLLLSLYSGIRLSSL
jgi:hypothetical protein